LTGSEKKSTTALIFSWIVTICRVLIGVLVMKTGFSLVMRTGSFYAWPHDSHITGIFVMIIGAYFIFSSLYHQIFDNK
jgi:hypothetical protein